jgi:hypothetical protein
MGQTSCKMQKKNDSSKCKDPDCYTRIENKYKACVAKRGEEKEQKLIAQEQDQLNKGLETGFRRVSNNPITTNQTLAGGKRRKTKSKKGKKTSKISKSTKK